MSVKISVKGYEESVSSSNYLRPGIHEVQLESVEAKVSQSGNPQLELKFTDRNGSSISDRYTFTEKTTKKAMGDMIHIFTAMGLAEEFKSIEAGSYEQFAAIITKLLVAKGRPFFRVKLLGKKNYDGTKVYTSIAPWAPFAEPLSTDPSNLAYSEDENDVPSAPVVQNASEQVDDLPFTPSDDDTPDWLTSDE